MFDSIDILSTALGAVVSAVVTLAGSFLYHKQERERRELENESKQSDEWKKLYLESKKDSDAKDKKIDELRTEINELRNQMIYLERKVQFASMYSCDKFPCPDRHEAKMNTEQ